MSDLEHLLHGVVDEGSRLARPPDRAELDRRLRRRRATGTVAALVLAVVAAGLVAGLVPRPGHAPAPLEVAPLISSAPRGTMSVTPTAVRPGQSIRVEGEHCGPGGPVFLHVGPAVRPRQIGTVTADRRGAFVATVQLPPDLPAGTTTVWAACRTADPPGKFLNRAPLTVLTRE
jgi:hypothetical protein